MWSGEIAPMPGSTVSGRLSVDIARVPSLCSILLFKLLLRRISHYGITERDDVDKEQACRELELSPWHRRLLEHI